MLKVKKRTAINNNNNLPLLHSWSLGQSFFSNKQPAEIKTTNVSRSLFNKAVGQNRLEELETVEKAEAELSNRKQAEQQLKTTKQQLKPLHLQHN